MLQAATGIGFGVIAGPILLVVLDGAEAFQISIIHNLLIAVVLMPLLFRHANRLIFRYLLIGALIGLPAGFVLQLTASISTLKMVSLAAVGFVAGTLVMDMIGKIGKSFRRPVSRTQTTMVGIVSGLMGGMLAMPGPVVATWMSIRGRSKMEVRATILSFFVVAYGLTLLLHILFGNLTYQTSFLSLKLAPVVLVGIVVGSYMTRFVSERSFRRILLIVLLVTMLSLIYSLLKM